MSLVSAPLQRTDTPGPSPVAASMLAMTIGQHLMAVGLTVIGVILGIRQGASIPLVVIAGAAILLWHTGGAILLRRLRRPSVIIWWLIGLGVLWVGAVAVTSEFIWLGFLLWLLLGHLLPLWWGITGSALVLAIVIAAPVLHHGTTSYANVFGPLIGGVFAFGISRGYLQLLRDATEREHLVASLRQARDDTAALQDELLLAQRHAGAIAERTRISRDIHDTVAQSLSSIRLLAHAEAHRTSAPEASRAFLQLESLASDGLVDARRIVDALLPAELDDSALAPALRRMLDRAHEVTGLEVELHVDDLLPLLPTQVEVALLRTAQSALANVRRHAHATRVVMSLIDDGELVRLDVIDDGDGFDATEVGEAERSGEVGASSHGLRVMRARLRELGGGLDVESAPGEGTAISAHLPVHLGTAPTRAGEPS